MLPANGADLSNIQLPVITVALDQQSLINIIIGLLVVIVIGLILFHFTIQK